MMYPQIKFTAATGKLAGQEVSGRQYGCFAVVKVVKKKTPEYPWASEHAYLYYVPEGLELRGTYGPTGTRRLYAVAGAMDGLPLPLPNDKLEFLEACIAATNGTPRSGRWGGAKWDLPEYRHWHEAREYNKAYDASTLTEPGPALDWSASGHFRMFSDGRTLCGHGISAKVYDRDAAVRRAYLGHYDGYKMSDAEVHCRDCERLLKQCKSRACHPQLSSLTFETRWVKAHAKTVDRAGIQYFPPKITKENAEKVAEIKALLLG